jgi:hypothetical protein
MSPGVEPTEIYFVSWDQTSGVSSYLWRIGSQSTSFYIKPYYKPLAALKISLHGPDPRPELTPGFRFGIDEGGRPLATSHGGILVTQDLDHGQRWFRGEEVGRNARLVAIFRVTSDLFADGVPSAPGPTKNLRSSARGSVIPAPGVGEATDVEIYLASGAPFWPNESQAKKDNACIGPIRNEANQYLTGLSVRRSATGQPHPPEGMSRSTGTPDNSVRALNVRVDEHEVLWILEEWMTSSFFIGEENGQREQHEQP